MRERRFSVSRLAEGSWLDTAYVWRLSKEHSDPLTVVFALADLVKGLDESFEALDSWFRYALVFSFLAIGWFAISHLSPRRSGARARSPSGSPASRPTPSSSSLDSSSLSDDNSTYLSGLSFQNLGTIVMLLALGWFLGLRRNL